MLPVLATPQLDQRDRYGWAPLHMLANNASSGEVKTQMIQQLVRAAADVDVLGNRGATPLHKAAGSAAISQVLMLLQLGADLDAQAAGGRAPRDAG